jgi:hypothetical protein
VALSQARSKDVSMARVEMEMEKARGSEEMAPKLPLSLFHLLRPAARMHHGGGLHYVARCEENDNVELNSTKSRDVYEKKS